MTEIEEKAYKYYKRINEDDLKNIDTFGEPTRTRIKYMQTLLDQIQNQEKEIEELKTITRAYDGMAGNMPEGQLIIIADKEYFDNGRFVQRCVSKDVIEEKIEEIDEVLKGQLIEKIRVYFEAQKEVLQSLLENETQPDRAEPVERADKQEVAKKVTKKVVKKITYKGEEFGHGATQEVVDDIDDYCTAINGLIDGLAIKINEIIDYLTGEEEANPDKQKTKRKGKK